MDAIKVPARLPDLVSDRFQEAKQAGDVLFWDSDVTLLHMNGIPVIISSQQGSIRSILLKGAYISFNSATVQP